MARFLYFSTQTSLAHRLCKRYFQSRFYVYCSDGFDPDTNPGSSNPAMLYRHLMDVAEGDDRGDLKAEAVRQALKQVALKKRQTGDISADDYTALTYELDHAASIEFRPYLYLIQRDALNSGQVTPVPVSKRASPTSAEYTITDLTEAQFDVIALRLRLTRL